MDINLIIEELPRKTTGDMSRKRRRHKTQEKKRSKKKKIRKIIRNHNSNFVIDPDAVLANDDDR